MALRMPFGFQHLLFLAALICIVILTADASQPLVLPRATTTLNGAPVGPAVSTSSISSTTAPPSLSIGSLSGYSHVGCIADNSSRLFPTETSGSVIFTISSNAPASCLSACEVNFHYRPKFLGVEYNYNCFCANSTSQVDIYTTNAAGCTSSCPGETGAQCGGLYFVNVYSLTATDDASLATSTSPAASASSSSSSSSASGGLGGGAIAGIAIGAALGGFLVALGIFFLRRRTGASYEHANSASPASVPATYQGFQDTGFQPKSAEMPGGQQAYELHNQAPPTQHEAVLQVHEMDTHPHR
jgi:hypothetical protein